MNLDEKIELYKKILKNIKKQWDNISKLLPGIPMEDKIFFADSITDAVTCTLLGQEEHLEENLLQSCQYRYKFRKEIKELSPTESWWFEL